MAQTGTDPLTQALNANLGNAQVTYLSLGNIPFLPQGTYDGVHPQDVLAKLSNLGTDPTTGLSYVVRVADYLTGQDYGSNLKGAASVVSSALVNFGKANGGVYAAVPQGKFNASNGRIRGGGGGGNGQSLVLGPGGDYGLSSVTAGAQLSAMDQISNYLYQWGMDTPAMRDWVRTQVLTPGFYRPSAEVVAEMRDPSNDSPGALAYRERFPGMAYRAFFKLPPISESEYISNERSYMQTARQYLSDADKSFITPKEIGILIGSDVSPQEFNDRVVNGYRLAEQALKNDPETARQLARMGVDTKHAAQYYLDPTKKYDDLMKTTQMGIIGGIASNTGFDKNLSKGVLGTLAAQQIGSPNSMDANYFRTHFENIAGLTGLESRQVGQRGQATASEKQLLGSEFAGLNKSLHQTAAGNAGAIRAAREARMAGLEGGGQMASTQKGVVGLGSASQAGTGQA